MYRVLSGIIQEVGGSGDRSGAWEGKNESENGNILASHVTDKNSCASIIFTHCK